MGMGYGFGAPKRVRVAERVFVDPQPAHKPIAPPKRKGGRPKGSKNKPKAK